MVPGPLFRYIKSGLRDVKKVRSIDVKGIVYFSFSELPSEMANSVHVMKMCQALAKRGYRVSLIAKLRTKNSHEAYAYYGVEKVFDIASFPMPRLRAIGRLIFLLFSILYIIRQRPALVYTRDFYGGFLLSGLGFDTVFECHENPSSALKKALLKGMFSNSNTKKVVYISKQLKQSLDKRLGENGKKVDGIVAHDGADIEAFCLMKRKKETRRGLNLPIGKFIIGYSGSLFQGRGISVIFELANRIKDALFVVVGGCQDDVVRAKKKAVARGMDNMVFVGQVPNALVPEWLSTFDLLLMPYQNRVTLKGNKGDTVNFMSPLKMFEYMASGKPIVSSRLPVLEEVLHDGTNAILVGPDDIDEWCRAVMRIKSDKMLAQKIGTRARMDVKRYSWTQRVKNIFEKLDY